MVWGLRVQRQRPYKTHQAKSGRQHWFCTSYAHFAFGSPTTITGIPAQGLRAELCLYPVIKVGSFFHKGNITQDTFNLTAASALHEINFEEAAATVEKLDASSYMEIWILKYRH